MNLCFKKFLWQEQRAGTVLSYQNLSLGFRRMFLKNQSHCDHPGAHYWLLGWLISPNFPPSLLCLYDTVGSAKKEAGKSTVFWVVWLSGWRGRLGSNVLGLTGLPLYICAVFEAVESWWLTTLEVQEKVLDCESRSASTYLCGCFHSDSPKCLQQGEWSSRGADRACFRVTKGAPAGSADSSFKTQAPHWLWKLSLGAVALS